jgi:hypothetical protein
MLRVSVLLIVLLFSSAALYKMFVPYAEGVQPVVVEWKPLNVLSVGTVKAYAYDSSGNSLNCEWKIIDDLSNRYPISGFHSGSYFHQEVQTEHSVVTCRYGGEEQTQDALIKDWSMFTAGVVYVYFYWDTGGGVSDPDRQISVTTKYRSSSGFTEYTSANIEVTSGSYSFTGTTTNTRPEYVSPVFKGSRATIKATYTGTSTEITNKVQTRIVDFPEQPTPLWRETIVFSEASPTGGDPEGSIHIGNTKDEISFQFEDGQDLIFKSGVSEAQVELALIHESELPSSSGYLVRGQILNFQVAPKVHEVLGTVYTFEPYGWSITIDVTAEVKSEGKVIHTSPDQGMHFYLTGRIAEAEWAKYDLHLAHYQRITEQQGGWFELINWNFDLTQAFRDVKQGETVQFKYDWKQVWTVEIIWPSPSSGGRGWYKELWQAEVKPIEGERNYDVTVPEDGWGTKPNFVIAADPLITIGINTGKIQYLFVDALGYNGFDAEVQFSIEDLPNGITATFKRNNLHITPTGPTNWVVGYNTYSVNTVAELRSSGSTDLGTYTPKIIVEGGGITRDTTFTLEVVTDTEDGELTYEPELHTEIIFITEKDAYKPSASFTLKGAVKTFYDEPVKDVELLITSQLFDEDKTMKTNVGGEFSVAIKLPEAEGTYGIEVKATDMPKGFTKPQMRTFYAVVDKDAGGFPFPFDPDDIVDWLLAILITGAAAIFGVIGPILVVGLILFILFMVFVWFIRWGWAQATKREIKTKKEE